MWFSSALATSMSVKKNAELVSWQVLLSLWELSTEIFDFLSGYLLLYVTRDSNRKKYDFTN